MKNIFKLFIAFAAMALFFTACHKVDDLPMYGTGTPVQLTSPVTSVAPAPADSLNKVLPLSWTSPNYAQDPSLYKFIIEIDSTGRNFANKVTRTVVGKLSDTLTAKELNEILVGFGFSFNTQYEIDVRVISSYGNNNEQYTSNTLKLQVTPYKVPPKVELPSSGKLFIVGDATVGGWGNPVPVPTQEFSRVDETTFMGVFDMVGGNQYLLLPVNGDWSNKYSVATNTLPGLGNGGEFGYNLPDNFPAPATSGTYLVVVDFQRGMFSVTPYTGPQIPSALYMVGDATPGGWSNPVPVPSQELTRLNSVEFELASIAITGGNKYLLLPVNGDWGNKYSVADNTLPGWGLKGYLGYNLAQDIPAPPTSGNYRINVNFAIHDPNAPTAATAQYTATPL